MSDPFDRQLARLRVMATRHPGDYFSEEDWAALAELLRRWDWLVARLAERGIDLVEAAPGSTIAHVWPPGRGLNEPPDIVDMSKP